MSSDGHRHPIDMHTLDKPPNTPFGSGFAARVAAKRQSLAAQVAGPLAELAARCDRGWPAPEALDHCLSRALRALPGCHLIYILDRDGRQLSSNVSPEGCDTARRGQPLGHRPYLQAPDGADSPADGLSLSRAYVSEINAEACITAVQRLRNGAAAGGCIAADFRLADLQLAVDATPANPGWQQFRGDPAIRGGLFTQTRVISAMEAQLDRVLALTERLLSQHGVFHAKLHLSSSRATLWSLRDPWRYQVHSLEELIDPAICLAYDRHLYPADALLAPEQIGPVLRLLAALRRCDETLYLRSGSLNIMNGLVGLNFSCDGSHYVPAQAFLERDLAFWLGQ